MEEGRVEKLRGFLWTNWGLMCSLVLFLNQGSSEGGKRGYSNCRGQNPAVGQDLRVPVGQDEQEGNSWEGWGRGERQASRERLSPVAQPHCSPVPGIGKLGLLSQLPCLPLPGVRKGLRAQP